MKKSRAFRPAFEPLEARDVPTFYGNQLFPADNPWNQKITDAPVAANSAAIISRIDGRKTGAAPYLHADFGNPLTDGALYGIPVNVVDGTVPKVTVTIPSFGYADESDIVQVPIPTNAVIEGDTPSGPAPASARGDSHLLVYDKAANVLYELYQAARPAETSFPYGGTKPAGSWGAYQISYWDLNKNSFRTVGATSADAAGLPILPGLARPDEANPPSKGGQGVITHALRMTVQQTLNTFVYPASHKASSLTATDLPRMGERFRLKSSFVIPSTWSPEAKAVAQAMKDYGLIVADNGSDLFFTGMPSDRWDGAAVRQVQSIGIASFEVVDLTPVVTGLSTTSGPAGTVVTVTGKNFGGAAGRLQVLFGGTPATAVTVVSGTEVRATAPAGTAGTAVDVRVRSGRDEVNTNNQSVFWGYGTSAVVAAGRFTYTAAAGTTAKPYAAGTGAGPVAAVTLYAPDGTVRLTARPFGAAYTGGVRVAVADVTGDGVADVVAGTNGGITAQLRVVDGATGAVGPNLFGATYYSGAVSVAAGDVDGDGVAEVAAGFPAGGAPRARVYRGRDFAKLADFAAGPAASYKGVAEVALGDLTGDGRADLAVSGNYAGGPRVFGWDGATLRAGQTPAKAFADQTLPTAYGGGLYLAAGDVDGDGFADLAVGAWSWGNSRATLYSGKDLVRSNVRKALADFVPAGAVAGQGVRVALRDVDGDGKTDLVTGSGRWLTAYAAATLPAVGLLPPVLRRLDTGLTAGIYVG